MTDAAVLVLNRNYQPIHVTSARRAFSLLYVGFARAIDEQMQTFDYESWKQLGAELGRHDVIHTVSRAIRIPRVIILQLCDRLPRTKVRFSRHNIYLRDGNTCQYCGRTAARTELNLDHVVPRAQGGRTSWENVVCCCIECNAHKGARTPDQAGMRLRRRPAHPGWTPESHALRGGVRHREWLPFLGVVDASYWNVELLDDDDDSED